MDTAEAASSTTLCKSRLSVYNYTKKITIPYTVKYAVVRLFTLVPGSMMIRGTNTCLQESLGRAGEVQISSRPLLLFSKARSSDPVAAAGTRYQNSRHASPSSPSGPLSNILTTASPGEKKANRPT